ncbi:hypothetical protein TNCV_2936621 [Trichonephila clavipes]|nr:hypothetical protein TNCV_2936621 [Trichonephila clavipes]
MPAMVGYLNHWATTQPHESHGSVYSSFQEEVKNSHDIKQQAGDCLPIHTQMACFFGNFFICAQHAKNRQKNICHIQTQLILEKQRGEEKKSSKCHIKQLKLT